MDSIKADVRRVAAVTFSQRELNAGRIPWQRLREALGESIVHIDVTVANGQPARLAIDSLMLPGVSCTWLQSRGVHMNRDPSHLMDGDHDLTLTIPVFGEFVAAQDGAGGRLRSGTSVLLRADQSSIIEAAGSTEFIGLKINRKALLDRMEGRRSIVSRVITQQGPTQRLLESYLFGLRANRERLDAEMVATVSGHLIDLVAGLLRASRPVPADANDARLLTTIREAARALMVRHHDDATLSCEDIAHWLDLEVRCLRNAFAAASSSFETELLFVRLGAYGRLLRDPEVRQFGAEALALRCGFDDLEALPAQFESFYGVSPEQYRNSRLV